MTPLTVAIASLALAVAIVAAFAAWLRHYANRHAGDEAAVATPAAFDTTGYEAAHCGDAGSD